VNSHCVKAKRQLFARHVIPHFRGTLRSHQASYDYCIDNREGFAAATTQAVQAANPVGATNPVNPKNRSWTGMTRALRRGN
jgi:hypothetical protein